MLNFATLITSHNTKIRISIALNLIGGLLIFLLTFWFFKFVPSFVYSQLSLNVDPIWFNLGSLTCVLIIIYSAIKAKRENREALTYNNSLDGKMLQALNAHPSIGSVVVDYYTSNVTAPAFVLSKLFLAGPNSFLKISEHLRRIIPNTSQTQTELASLHQAIKENGKWHSTNDYLHQIPTLIKLADLNLIDLDLYKGRVKVDS